LCWVWFRQRGSTERSCPYRVSAPTTCLASASIGAAAQPAHAADRFAHEIGRILTVFAVRSRRLMGKAFGTRGSVIDSPFHFGSGESGVLNARCANSVVPKPVV